MKSVFATAAAAFIAFATALAETPEKTTTDYSAVAEAIDKTMRAYHYNPEELEGEPYQEIVSAVSAMAETVETDEAFIGGFREIWRDGPFSHVELRKANGTADEMAAHLDAMRVGGGGAVLSWRDETAVLTVNTMMGLDTIEEINAAYEVIAERGADKLIIDLRENGGGAFAVLPLVSHLIDQPFIAGAFVSQPWNAAHDRAPTLEDMKKAEPWEGWSVRAFWEDAQEQPLTVVQFEPSAPAFEGPVYVLTSKRTASASELATDALKAAGRATIIGERTAGAMLSQKMYDIVGGFHLSLPIADYYSAKHGRIEGAGVEPHIETSADEALNVALGR